MEEQNQVKGILGDFEKFTITVPENVRYWEDESTGIIVQRNKPPVTINSRQFRSHELKFGLLRNRILIKEGECRFVFKGQIIEAKPGDHKNLIKVIRDFTGGVVSEDVVFPGVDALKNTVTKVTYDLKYDDKNPLKVGIPIEYSPISV